MELEKRKENPLGEPTLPVGSSPQLTYKVGEEGLHLKQIRTLHKALKIMSVHKGTGPRDRIKM